MYRRKHKLLYIFLWLFVIISISGINNIISEVYALSLWKKFNWKRVSAIDNYTLFKPYNVFKLDNTNYNNYTVSPWTYTALSWVWDWIKIAHNSTQWVDVYYYNINQLKESRNFHISYDIMFLNNAVKWWFKLWNDVNFIILDINPSILWLNQNDLYHIDIIGKEINENQINIKIKVNDVIKKDNTYNFSKNDWYNFIDRIGIVSSYTTWDIVISNLNVILLDYNKITNTENPIHMIQLDNWKELFKYIYNWYWKPFGTKHWYWDIQLAWCVGDYSLINDGNWWRKCESWCRIWSSKIWSCKIK